MVALPVNGTACPADRYWAVALYFSDSLQLAYFAHVHVRANQVNGFAAWQIDLGKIDPSAVFEESDIMIGVADPSGAAEITDGGVLLIGAMDTQFENQSQSVS